VIRSLVPSLTATGRAHFGVSCAQSAGGCDWQADRVTVIVS
jgi:hypothetical protein